MFDCFTAPKLLNNGLLMTIYSAFYCSRIWQKTLKETEPTYQSVIFKTGEIPLFGKIAIPANPQGTIVATYGITGTLDNQWLLQILARKAYAQNYAIILFDWRAHGESAILSSSLTSDGLNEGKDFIRIAAESKAMGCPAPFWLTGYSLGGQLALWGIYYSQFVTANNLQTSEIAGGAVICPNLDSNRSLPYLMQHPLGKYLEKAIAKELRKLALKLHSYHPDKFELTKIASATTIWDFDRELVIPRLGFNSVEDYYTASSAFQILDKINKPTLILYAQDDPMFAPTIIPDLQQVSQVNQDLELVLTESGGHVGYISSLDCQQKFQDHDRWWAWNRILDWINQLGNI